MSTESTTLAQVSAGFAAAVETAGASTVLVNARRRIPASGVVWSADGTIVTAHHVIERDEVEVVLADGSKHQATVAGRDPGSDIAVLKIGPAGLTPALRAPAGSAKVGNLVLAVGRPSLEGPMASLGVVGAIGGAIVGWILGSQIGYGEHQGAATVAGAIIGGAIGSDW